jgi:UDP-2-acetamido-3-amino-2,3-dideoxy-glucuronate N-acetyltransferase
MAISLSRLLPRPDVAPGLMLGEGVEIPPETTIGVNVVIHAGCTIGSGVVLQDGAVIGKSPHLGPRSSASREQVEGAILGDDVAVLSGAIVFAGTRLEEGSIAGDQCHVRERSVIGAGSVIGRGSAIDNDVTIGAGVRIQTNCYVTGFTVIDDHAFVGPGVITANDNTMARHPAGVPLSGPRLGRACRIGAGAVLCPGVQIGPEAFVAAGSVVVADVPPRAVVMGVPARRARKTPEQDLLENWL